MTSFKESAKRTISSVKKRRTGWIVDFADGSCRLIKKTEKKGYAQIKPGMVIESCRSRCNGPDENGNCTWRPMGPRTNNVPQIACQEQFVYAYKPHNFGQEKPKFERGIQKMSYRIKSYRTIKPTKANPVEQVALVFEDGSQKTFLKSVFLGHAVIKHGQHVVPCGEECEQRGGECSYCHGTRRGTLCQQQFYFSRKCLKRHTKDKIK
ncbi:MAG: hypothetical protein IJ866_03930 [Alphaproteobacteria bacterium]|nr:hypothetical protein [Alphaproteobacteria bacterium]